MFRAFETIIIYAEEGRDLASPDKLAVKNLKTGEITYPGDIRRPKEEDFHNLINQFNQDGFDLKGVDRKTFYLSKEIK